MNRYLSSFLRGVGSVLGISSTEGAVGPAHDCVEAMAGDFARVGLDIQKSIDAKAAMISSGRAAPNEQKRKEEQLEFQGV